jgi:hypothetical protein
MGADPPALKVLLGALNLVNLRDVINGIENYFDVAQTMLDVKSDNF